MSTKASIAAGDTFHLYKEELLSSERRSVFLNLEKPSSYEFSKETFNDQIIESLTIGIPSEVLDELAIRGLKYRKLQGAFGGPVGLEWGSPDCPYP